MQFQSFLDPFGYALRAESQRLQNDAKAIENQTQLYGLATTRMRFDAMAKDMQDAANGAASVSTQPLATPEGIKEVGASASQLDANGNPVQNMPNMRVPAPSEAMGANVRAIGESIRKMQRYGSDPKAIATEQKAYEDAYKGYVDQKDKEFKERMPFFDRVANALYSGAQNPEGFGQEIARLQREVPPGMDLWNYLYGDDKTGKGLGLKPGPGGVPIIDPVKFKLAGQNSALAKTQFERDYKLKQQQYEQERINTAHRNTQLAEQRLELAERRSREGEGTRDELLRMRKEAADARFIEHQATSLHREELYKDEGKYEASVDVANRTLAQLDAKGGYANFTTSDADAFVKAAQNMFQGYRARYASASETKRINGLNGMIQNMQKYVTTIGTGDKQVAYDTAKQMAGVMQAIYADRNEAIVRTDLGYIQAVAKKGLDPEDLKTKGDLKSLVEQKRAKLETDDKGNVYAIVRRPGQSTMDLKFLIRKAGKKEDE